jgi:hypothetical protein
MIPAFKAAPVGGLFCGSCNPLQDFLMIRLMRTIRDPVRDENQGSPRTQGG